MIEMHTDIILDRKSSFLGKYCPEHWWPYIVLMRLDRPVGAFLLLWPCLWGYFLMAEQYVSLNYLMLFLLGAFVMRSVGCILNDIADRKIDKYVTRTQKRPLPSGLLSLKQAFICLGILSAVGLGILLFFNTITIYVGLCVVGFIVLYPFMKRWTYWPQICLGITFNWGIWIGAFATGNEVDMLLILLLYAAAILWTVGYDSIYACQDTSDDRKIGIYSTALLWGKHIKLFVGVCYAGTVLLLILIFLYIQPPVLSFSFLLCAIALLLYQLGLDYNNPILALRSFKCNIYVGLFIALSFLAYALI